MHEVTIDCSHMWEIISFWFLIWMAAVMFGLGFIIGAIYKNEQIYRKIEKSKLDNSEGANTPGRDNSNV